MRKEIRPLLIIFGLVIILSVSCKKEDSPSIYYNVPDYKSIYELNLSGDELWVVSSDPYYLETYLPILQRYQVSLLNLTNDRLLTNDSIPAITKMGLDKDQKPFLATYDKKILKLNQDLSYEKYLVIPGIHSIQKILFDKNNVLWVATYSGGLFYYDGTDTARFNTSNSILNSNSIQWLTMDSESNIWFIQGTELFKVDRNMNLSKDTTLFPISNKTSTEFISADKNNALWVAKWDGNHFRIFRKNVDSPWTEVPRPASAKERPVKFIKTDKNGSIWIVYSDYPKDILAYYDTDKWVEIQIPLDEVIVNDFVLYKNELILGTPKGVYRMPMR